MQQALVILKQVLEIDSEYEEAWEDLAWVYYMGGRFGLLHIDNIFTLAREAAERALTINSDLALANTILSNIELIHNRDLKAAVGLFNRAMELEPNNLGNFDIGNLLLVFGRRADWLVVSELKVANDPLNEWNHLMLGDAYTAVGRSNEALVSLRTAQSMSPQMPFVSYGIGWVLMLEGKPEAALLEFNQEQIESARLTGQVMAHFAVGQLAQSDTALAELKEKHGEVSAIEVAAVLAYSLPQ